MRGAEAARGPRARRRLIGMNGTVFYRVRQARQPQLQKQLLTQIRGAGSDCRQPHMGLGASQSLSELHSL